MHHTFGYFPDITQGDADQILTPTSEAKRKGVGASNHFRPHVHTNVTASFAWMWRHTLDKATNRAAFEREVTEPKIGNNPAVAAWAFAILGNSKYPGRTFISLGADEVIVKEPQVGCLGPSSREGWSVSRKL